MATPIFPVYEDPTKPKPGPRSDTPRNFVQTPAAGSGQNAGVASNPTATSGSIPARNPFVLLNSGAAPAANGGNPPTNAGGELWPNVQRPQRAGGELWPDARQPITNAPITINVGGAPAAGSGAAPTTPAGAPAQPQAAPTTSAQGAAPVQPAPPQPLGTPGPANLPGATPPQPGVPQTIKFARQPLPTEAALYPAGTIFESPMGTFTKLPDGQLSPVTLSGPGQAAVQAAKIDAVKRFGYHPLAGDANAPPPPAEPGRRDFNPYTGHWTQLDDDLMSGGF